MNLKKIISPIGKMVLQSEDMKRSTDIDSDYIESQFEFRGLAASKSPPEYWKNLGSSKTRSEEQAFQGKTIILEKIQQLKKNTTLAFTDGSCKGNPGPCGAGAAILISNSTEHVELTQPVSNRGSILLGELVAIKLVIDFLIIPNNRKNTESIKIFSDSQSAIGILTLNWKSDNYGKTIHDIKIGILALKSEGIIVSIEWTPGHADIQGNELADQLAKKAAQEAEKIQSIPIFTKQDIQKGAKDSVMLKWQNRWDTSEKGRRYYAFQQNVKNTIPKDKPSTEIYRITTSLRTGYCNLNSYKSMICPALIDKCSCGQIETVDHYLLDCENYEEAREKLRSALYFITSKLTLESEVLLATTENDNYKHHIEDIQDLLGVLLKILEGSQNR
ncbi:RNASEH1 [Mytilus edulis]|uniref:ribonuclease H n=1 Tax=Mytilus edulis TaxID=6550 RepID=A0A8S3S4M7_MYTED|nr:RNASEH1 [Mytilus edulis]